MEKRYLIDNNVYEGSEVPFTTDVNFYTFWKKSLVKLDCDESELEKIITHLQKINSIGWLSKIDITSITTVKDGNVYFKEADTELKYTTQEMIDAVNYGFKYATESQNNGVDVPIGNILQWIMYKRNLLNVPKEFELFKHNQTK